MNEMETEKLTGIKIIENDHVAVDKAIKAADLLIGNGAKTVICHFPEGAVAHSANMTSKQGSALVPQEEITGSTGAGDALAAGFLLGIRNNKPIGDCLHLGICAATASLHHASCSGGILPIQECIDLGRKYGFREIN